MPYEMLKQSVDVECADIPNMLSMTHPEYDAYMRGFLLHVDHHGYLRSLIAGYPLACTKLQMTALIDYLTELSSKIER